MELSAIFFCEIATVMLFPFIPTANWPKDFTALNAYSIWYSLPSGENTVILRSYPELRRSISQKVKSVCPQPHVLPNNRGSLPFNKGAFSSPAGYCFLFYMISSTNPHRVQENDQCVGMTD